VIKKALIFDIDGTLLDLQKAESEAYARAFEVCFGLTGISTDWDSYPAHTDIALAKDILCERWGRPCLDCEWHRIMDTYNSILKEEVYGLGKFPILVPGVGPLLDHLSDRKDVGLALATGNAREIAQLRMTQAGIWQYFQGGGFAEDGDKKSQILTKAISDCRTHWPALKLADILYLGDSEGDISAADSNGVNFIRISPRIEPNVRFKTYAHFLDLEQFMAAVTQVWGD
jgi:phosphoglycolate phosphatase-like HAD superfamily hydrolase